MTKLKAFADESAVLEISELTIENRLDRVSLYGSIDLTKDKAGLTNAQQLKAVLDQVVAILGELERKGDLPDQVQISTPTEVDNPFK